MEVVHYFLVNISSRQGAASNLVTIRQLLNKRYCPEAPIL